MRWLFESTSQKTATAVVQYRPNEESFDTIPFLGEPYTSILVRDVSIEVDEAGYVIGAWGYSPKASWREARLQAPLSSLGRAKLVIDSQLSRGVSASMAGRWDATVLHDPESGWVRIGLPDVAGTKSTMIVEGLILTIDEAGSFVALWLKPSSR